MKRLILMRHAKTEPWSEGLDDFARALLPRGISDAQLVAEEIKQRGWSPNLILVSTARRARETCSEVAKIIEDERVRPMEALYLSGMRGLTEAVSSAESEHSVMLIGHNPGLHDFACEIFREGGTRNHPASLRLHEKFPTGCAALFEAEEESAFVPAHFTLVDVIRAKDLRQDD